MYEQESCERVDCWLQSSVVYVLYMGYIGLLYRSIGGPPPHSHTKSASLLLIYYFLSFLPSFLPSLFFFSLVDSQREESRDSS
jgi:hypothetical protein